MIRRSALPTLESAVTGSLRRQAFCGSQSAAQAVLFLPRSEDPPLGQLAQSLALVHPKLPAVRTFHLHLHALGDAWVGGHKGHWPSCVALIRVPPGKYYTKREEISACSCFVSARSKQRLHLGRNQFDFTEPGTNQAEHTYVIRLAEIKFWALTNRTGPVKQAQGSLSRKQSIHLAEINC